MLQNYSTWRVARVFFDEPLEEHYLMEISEKSELSHTSVKRHLEKLMRFNIILEEELERGERIYPIYKRIDNERYRLCKRLDLQYRLEASGLLDFIQWELTPDCIVLFGPAAMGKDVEGSDIDLYVQAGKTELGLDEYEGSLSREIQLHMEDSIDNFPKRLVNNIVNGIVVYGFLEVSGLKN